MTFMTIRTSSLQLNLINVQGVCRSNIARKMRELKARQIDIFLDLAQYVYLSVVSK